MKKLIAILLLNIHLFNLGGYQVLYQYFIYQSDKVMNEHISKNMYNIRDLVEVKLPVHLPQVSGWNDFQYISGQIQFREACYNYVKLKITSDTLYVMCIPNYEKTRLISSNIICAKQLADLPASKHDNLPALKKSASENYYFEPFNFKLGNHTVYLDAIAIFITPHAKEGITATPYLPPDAIC